MAYNMNNQDAGAINALAYANILGGKPLKALELYLEANKINPTTTYNYAGWCYFQLGEFEKAILWANKNIKNDPKNSIYYIDMGNATNALGLFDYTIAYINKALEINANHSFAYDNLRELAFYRRNYTEALHYLQRAMQNGESAEYEYIQGIIYFKMDSLDKAYSILNTNFRESFNEDSGDENSKIIVYELMQYQALVMMKMGEENKGRTVLQELMVSIENNISDGRPQKYYLLAGSYATLGNTDKSLSYLNQLFDLGYNTYFEIINNSLLDPLHGNPEYEEILKKIKEKNDKMREKVLQNGNLTK